MTFNLRFENDFDGENHWLKRRDFLVKTIQKHRPHLLGTQEGKPLMLEFLNDSLEGYQLSADSRIWEDHCQYPTLYYLTDYFVSLDHHEFWLSETPEVHMSKSWDSAFPRMISHSLLEVKNSDRQIWVSVTHLDHISKQARLESARMIRAWTVEKQDPILLLGDFNDLPGSEVHQTLRKPFGPFNDSWQMMGKAEDQHSYTQHGFTGVPSKGRIDWILVTSEFRILEVSVVRDHKAGRYPSDHFPLLADLQLK
jgi:endonuclease/exonuclease/phosphatase family metal-dependent hydrolase